MTKPDFTPLTSSLLTGYRYEPNSRELVLRFANGAAHAYEDVSAEKVESLAGSASPGRYFTDKIKGVHGSRKVK